jgi:CBS domain-containing protein
MPSEREIFTLAPSAKVVDAAKVMAERHVGAVVIATDARPVGILTDRDLVVRVLAPGLDPAATAVETVMSRDLVTAPDDLAPGDVALLMGERGVRRVPLVGKDGKLRGILSHDDLVALYGHGFGCLARAIAREQVREARGP